jgi:hypothetical protein
LWEYHRLEIEQGMITMGTPATAAKRKYNRSHYTRIFLEIDAKLAADLKAKCAKDGNSVTGVFLKAAAEYLARPTTPGGKPHKPAANRGQRRKDTLKCIKTLEAIMDDEQEYIDRIPENLRGGTRFDEAEETVSHIQAALDELGEAF